MSGALRLATIVRRNMATAFARGPFYLGLDSSTQGLKATLVTPALEPVATAAVNYDRDLPQFNTTNGVLDRGNGVVTTPSLMVRHVYLYFHSGAMVPVLLQPSSLQDGDVDLARRSWRRAGVFRSLLPAASSCTLVLPCSHVVRMLSPNTFVVRISLCTARRCARHGHGQAQVGGRRL